jgi:hypothetical protein
VALRVAQAVGILNLTGCAEDNDASREVGWLVGWLVGLDQGRAGHRIGPVGGWMIPGSVILIIYERFQSNDRPRTEAEKPRRLRLGPIETAVR